MKLLNHLFRFIQKHYDEIKGLFKFDSKLLTLLPYVCPQKETFLLCQILPIELAIVWLIERLRLDKPYSFRGLPYIEDSKVRYFAVMYDYMLFLDGTLLQEPNGLYHAENF